MYTCFLGIFLPDVINGLTVNSLKSVPGYNIKFAHRVVVLRWVTCSYNYPAFGDTMSTENLVLQKLKHSRGKSF